MEPLWLRRARRGAKLSLVLQILFFPFTLWGLTKAWHGPVIVWLARHPWHALGDFKAVITAAAGTAGAIVSLLVCWRAGG